MRTSIQNKKKIKVVQLAPEAPVQKAVWPSLEAAGSQSHPMCLPTQPRVELVNRPDGKSTIVVTCTCGKRMEILCEG